MYSTTVLQNCQINININIEKTNENNGKMSDFSIDEYINRSFKQRKEDTIIMHRAYRAAGLIEKSYRMEQCFTIAKFWQPKDKEKVKLIYANSCRVRLCPSCAWRRSMKYYKDNKEIFAVADKKHYRYVMLTVTMKNCKPEDLSHSLDIMLEGYHRMMKYKEVKQIVLGAVRSVEITYNSQEKTFHPHIHALLVVPSSYFSRHYMTQADWAAYWAKACDLDYIPVTDIRAYKPQKGNSIAEMSKYIVKYSDILHIGEKELAAILPYLDSAIANRRMITYSGVLRQIRQQLRITDELPDTEPIDPTDEGYIYLYRWHWGLSRYVQTTEEEWTISTSAAE